MKPPELVVNYAVVHVHLEKIIAGPLDFEKYL
jgi:hypothetical protein